MRATTLGRSDMPAEDNGAIKDLAESTTGRGAVDALARLLAQILKREPRQ